MATGQAWVACLLFCRASAKLLCASTSAKILLRKLRRRRRQTTKRKTTRTAFLSVFLMFLVASVAHTSRTAFQIPTDLSSVYFGH